MELKYDSLFDEEYKKCICYALEKIGKKTALNWKNQFQIIQNQLLLMPESYAPIIYFHNRTRVFRGAIIMKNFKVAYFYNEEKDILWFVDLWDMRQNPKKLTVRASKIEKKKYFNL